MPGQAQLEDSVWKNSRTNVGQGCGRMLGQEAARDDQWAEQEAARDDQWKPATSQTAELSADNPGKAEETLWSAYARRH